MAAEIAGVFEEGLREKVEKAKVLIVGAGGIGCELLKNIVLSGFKDIEIIDLDTIDVSNLNRQFLFHKKHVGKSKAEVARESALAFNPNVNIKAYHDSITSLDYGVNFYKKFALVMNALDNRAARNHVNRMCLAADIPLIESGTAGYDGQVELIKKGLTQCYECHPKAAQKTYPGCTIRNTPSEPIHCIVWAKHLFNQLFGEEDPDEDVSPDTADPEAAGDAGSEALKTNANEKGNVERVATRTWAQKWNYAPEKLFQKLFHDDIKYLLSMDNLWKKRRPPIPLTLNKLPDAGKFPCNTHAPEKLIQKLFHDDIKHLLSMDNLWKKGRPSIPVTLNKLPNAVAGSSKNVKEGVLKDQKFWSIAECGRIFEDSVKNLTNQFQSLKEGDHLIWDKDDKSAMDFVASCANLRAYIFGISQKTRFDIKSMAGNIIPAIATTNAVIAGLVVLHAFHILEGKFECCQSVYLRTKLNHRKQQIVPEKLLNPPNKRCYVCAAKPMVNLCLDVGSMTVKEFEEQVLKKALNMVAPDVIHKGTIFISSEEGETEANNTKTLSEFGIVDGSILKVDDFLVNYELNIVINQRSIPKDGPAFEVVADMSELRQPTPDAANGTPDQDDDLELVDDSKPSTEAAETKKRKSEAVSDTKAKKQKVSEDKEEGKEEVMIV